MIDFMKLPAHEAEALAYAEGFTGTAALFARLADLQQALGETLADLENLKSENLALRRDIVRLQREAA